MSGRRRTGRWSVADRISVVVVLGAAAVITIGWQSGAIGARHDEGGSPEMAWGPGAWRPALWGDPATGMPWP